MKKKLLKFFIIIGALALLLTIISTTQVQAVLQSNPNTHYKKATSPDYWIKDLRNSEVKGGALGLSEIINSNTLVPTSESNNLDSHMMKSTEYGAIAILSASGYGNSKKLQQSTIKSTTGNETGLYFSGSHWEYVAAEEKSNIYYYRGVNQRYIDVYGGTNASAKVGDALGTKDTINPGCAGWHSASESAWIGNGAPAFRRGNGGIFSYKNSYYAEVEQYARGVVVCGEGL